MRPSPAELECPEDFCILQEIVLVVLRILSGLELQKLKFRRSRCRSSGLLLLIPFFFIATGHAHNQGLPILQRIPGFHDLGRKFLTNARVRSADDIATVENPACGAVEADRLLGDTEEVRLRVKGDRAQATCCGVVLLHAHPPVVSSSFASSRGIGTLRRRSTILLLLCCCI